MRILFLIIVLMATFNECQNMLKTQFIKGFAQKDNISQLMTNARWSSRSECLSHFWSVSNVNTFLENVQANNNEQREIYDTDHNSAEQTTTVETDSTWMFDWFKEWLSIVWHFLQYTIITWLVIRFLIVRTKRFLRRWYAIINHTRLVYMKVLVPRWDSKTDREQAKEIAKDMKEKIWRMSQVYTNMSKLWKLNFYDKIMYKLVRKPRISLIYHYENWMLNFIIWCYPEYKNIIEWSIWAQYPESSIEVIKEPNIFKKKYSKVMPLQWEKDSVYTLKLYKKMSDDPINNIIDAIWNISKYDTATIMLNIKPLRDNRNEQAKKKIDRLYKNLDLPPEWILWKIWFWIKKFFKLMTSWESPKWKDADDVTMVRMVKAQEDTLNDMWEEAWSPAFETW